MLTKRNIRSRAKDALVVLFCLAGAFMSLNAFARELNAALVKFNEGPVAIITFKHRSAQRRIAERVLWDRLRQESPVYNGDTIRTAELSEATLHFPDGTGVDLTENTMIQIIVKDSTSREVSLESGSVVVSGGDGESSLALSSGGKRLTLSAGGSVAARAASDTGGLSVRVIEGFAETTSGERIEGGESASLSDSGTLEAAPARLASPEPNARFVQHGAGGYPVAFRLSDKSDASGYTVVLSRERAFAQTKQSVSLQGENAAETRLPEGAWYWRLLDGSDIREEGQFRIYSAPDPAPIAPAEGYAYSYRARKPAVRFLWTSNPYASFWRLTVADNPGMNAPVVDQRCSNPSSIVSSLAEGRWYWRVAPWYPINDEGFSGETAVRSFTIRRSGDLLAPALIVPRANEILNTRSTSRSLAFSWRDNPDIDTTRITISASPTLASPVVDAVVRDNVYAIDRARANLADGQWYWAVRQQDSEGAQSPASEVRPFIALSGDLVQRASYPPEGYSISQNLAADTPFTWKTNVPSDTRFQVSATNDFAEPFVDSVQNGGTASGSELPVGTWYWRVVARLGDLELATPPRQVAILPPLDTPTPVFPSSGGRVVIRPGVPSVFKWNPVEGATMYTLKLFRPASGTTPLYERSAIEGTEATVALDSLAEGSWYWTIQALAEETPLSTRRVGVIGQYPFDLKRLKPISLDSPASGLRVDGIEAVLRPGTVKWSSIERPASARLVISRSKGGLDARSIDNGSVPGSDDIVIENPARSVRLPRLEAGTWWWTVVGFTEDGFNISPNNPSSIAVSAIPRLPKSSLIEPRAGEILGPDFFSSNKSIAFSWEVVPGATHYRFELLSPSGKVALVSKETAKTSVVLTDLKALNSGKFRWTVEAVRIVDGVIVLQRGESARSDFKIDIPELSAPRSRTKRTLYGN